MRARRHIPYSEDDNFGINASDTVMALWKQLTGSVFAVTIGIVAVFMVIGGIVIIASPDGLFSVPHQPCIMIPAAARHQHDIGPGDHVLLAAAPDYGVVVVHTRQAMNEMLARYHSTFGSPDRQAHE